MFFSRPSLRVDILTIFPSMIEAYVTESILGRAQTQKRLMIRAHDLRIYADDKHKKVDDTPYGGGPGMVMRVQPFDAALAKLKKKKNARVILTAANGKPFTQADAKRLAQYEQIIFLCGRYEGIDQRVEDYLVDEVFSIGSYVLTGGELPAMVMTDAIARMIPGVLGKEASLERESHTQEGYLEHPQYTKPEVYVSKSKNESWRVPEVLLSGNHAQIELWREAQSKKRNDQ